MMTTSTPPAEFAASSASPAPTDAQTWDAFVTAHSAAHLLQLSGWGALKERFGWRAERVMLPGANGTAIGAGALLLFQRRFGITLGYVPRGPILQWEDERAARALLDALAARCRRAGAALLKIEPELPDTAQNRALLERFGLRFSPQTVQPRSTIVVDLEGDEEQILARMKSKWRYNIRLAQRKGITVRACTRADLPAFHALMTETAQRDAFDVHTPAYYDAAFDLLTPDYAVFLLAEFEGRPLAAIVVGVAGKRAWYLWGASSDRERSRMPNHALQWAGMQWARARGAQRYDLWGIPDALGEVAQGLRGGDGSGVPCEAIPVDVESLPSEGLWGVYRFKQGFGGEVVRMVGAWDLPVRAPDYAMYQLGLKALEVQRTIKRAAAQRAHWQQPAGPTPVTHATEWRRALAALPAPHVLQSWEWGDVKAQTGWQAERLLLPGGQGALQFLMRQPLPALPIRIGYIPKGPVLDWSDGTAVATALDAIESHARARRCILVKIDPDVCEESPEGQALLAVLRRRGWLYSREQVQFKNTAISDLRGDEGQMLQAMKSKWRYNVRLAEKRMVHVRQGSEADMAAFYALYAETAARDGFLIRPFDYYRRTWETFLRAQQEPDNPAGAVLLLAEHAEEDTPLAGLFLLRYGETAWYFYGASSERRRRDMPNYLLQWEALQWARAQGCTRYDWWGAPTNIDDPQDAMQGVWGFKQGFGAEQRLHIGAWDYPVYPLLYRAYVQALPRVLAIMRRAAGRRDRASAPSVLP